MWDAGQSTWDSSQCTVQNVLETNITCVCSNLTAYWTHGINFIGVDISALDEGYVDNFSAQPLIFGLMKRFKMASISLMVLVGYAIIILFLLIWHGVLVGLSYNDFWKVASLEAQVAQQQLSPRDVTPRGGDEGEGLDAYSPRQASPTKRPRGRSSPRKVAPAGGDGTDSTSMVVASRVVGDNWTPATRQIPQRVLKLLNDSLPWFCVVGGQMKRFRKAVAIWHPLMGGGITTVGHGASRLRLLRICLDIAVSVRYYKSIHDASYAVK